MHRERPRLPLTDKDVIPDHIGFSVASWTAIARRGRTDCARRVSRRSTRSTGARLRTTAERYRSAAWVDPDRIRSGRFTPFWEPRTVGTSGASPAQRCSRSSAAPTISGNRTVTSPSTVVWRAVALTLPQEIASRVRAPERLPSHSTAVVR